LLKSQLSPHYIYITITKASPNDQTLLHFSSRPMSTKHQWPYSRPKHKRRTHHRRTPPSSANSIQTKTQTNQPNNHQPSQTSNSNSANNCFRTPLSHLGRSAFYRSKHGDYRRNAHINSRKTICPNIPFMAHQSPRPYPFHQRRNKIRSPSTSILRPSSSCNQHSSPKYRHFIPWHHNITNTLLFRAQSNRHPQRSNPAYINP